MDFFGLSGLRTSTTMSIIVVFVSLQVFKLNSYIVYGLFKASQGKIVRMFIVSVNNLLSLLLSSVNTKVPKQVL